MPTVGDASSVLLPNTLACCLEHSDYSLHKGAFSTLFKTRIPAKKCGIVQSFGKLYCHLMGNFLNDLVSKEAFAITISVTYELRR